MITQIIIKRGLDGWVWGLYNESDERPVVAETAKTLRPLINRLEDLFMRDALIAVGEMLKPVRKGA